MPRSSDAGTHGRAHGHSEEVLSAWSHGREPRVAFSTLRFTDSEHSFTQVDVAPVECQHFAEPHPVTANSPSSVSYVHARRPVGSASSGRPEGASVSRRPHINRELCAGIFREADPAVGSRFSDRGCSGTRQTAGRCATVLPMWPAELWPAASPIGQRDRP